MRIINLDNTDYHTHTMSFSDGLNSIDEVVKYAGEIWLNEIAITDHSQAAIDMFKEKHGFFPVAARYSIKRRKNVHNDVNVIFWVEGDLLNENWDVCFDIQWIEPEFIILSAHSDVYKWKPETVTEATIKAIKKHHDKIKFIWHPCNNWDFWKYIEIEKIVEVANKYSIPLEFNAKNLNKWKTNLKKLDYLLKNANEVYINSDAHVLWELRDVRKLAIEFLKENKYI